MRWIDLLPGDFAMSTPTGLMGFIVISVIGDVGLFTEVTVLYLWGPFKGAHKVTINDVERDDRNLKLLSRASC